MKRIFATGFDDYFIEDRPVMYITQGGGNDPDHLEVHIDCHDPATARSFGGWFRVSELEEALSKAQWGHL